MIIVRIIGGLGNQMFQYAAARALAITNNCPLKLDLEWFKTPGSRPYMLDRFNIHANVATLNEIVAYTGKFKDPLKKTCWLLSRPLSRKKVFREPGFEFTGKFAGQPPNTYLKGNWQSPRYFSHIRDILLEEFSIQENISPSTAAIANDIHSRQAVSLHIRRGDYVTNRQAQQFHGNLGFEYYHKAIEIISSSITNPFFYIFSDDIEWVSQHFNIYQQARYIAGNSENKSHEDMLLMSICRHHIIANSSFSWWGAWLNKKENKTVIAPKQWFRQEKQNRKTKDIIPGKWITI